MRNTGFAGRVPGWHLRIIVAMIAFFFTLFPNLAVAQVGGSGITGTITDTTGALIPNAKVTVKNEATGVVWTTTSTGAGVYIVRDLSPGPYSVTVESSGFQKEVLGHVVLEVDRLSSADVRLAVGSVTQTVQVEAAPNQLDTTSGTIGNLVTQKELETLPLNGRSWVSLNYLTPGATTFIGSSMNFSNITQSVAPGNVVLNGLRGGNNLFFIDGVSTADVEDFIISVYPPLDALAEFRTQSGNATAEYFGGAGAMVSAATKSGTNDFHGDLWEYLRNQMFDARDYFSSNVPKLERNQFGFTFGGPIQKDKTFFFVSYEGFRELQGDPFVGDFPTAAMRAGDLSSVSTQLIDPYTQTPIPGNNVTSLINPLSTKYLNDWIPLPNTNVPIGFGNYRRVAIQPIDYDSYVIRGDHRFSEKSSLFVRYLWSKASSLEPVIEPGYTRDQYRPGTNIAIDYTHEISTTVVAEARFGFQRYDDHEEVDNAKNANMEAELGVVGAVGFSTNPNSELSPPCIMVSCFAPFGDTYFGRPRRIVNDSFYYDGLLFMTRGRHAMKMGVNITHNRDNFPEICAPTGEWNYNGTFTGNAFADYLLGIPRSISTEPDLFDPDARRSAEGLWFQDDLKATSKLTLNLGLRWDRDGGYVSADDSVANYDLSNPPVAVNITGKNRPPGWGPALFDAPWNKLFAPRVGFAYRATTNTVVRGGYGMYWEPMTADPLVNISINAPFIESYAATIEPSDLATFNRANPLASTSPVGAFASIIERNFQPGYVQQWNLTIERNVGGTLFSIGYVGNKGTHLVAYDSYNFAPPGPGDINPRRPYTELLIEPNAGGIVPAGIIPAGGMFLQESGRDSIYHALDLSAKRRFAHGLSFTTAFSFAKGIDDTAEGWIEGRALTTQEPWNPKAERAICDFCPRFALTFGYVYVLPFGPGEHFAGGVGGIGGKLIGGWQLEGLTRLQSGIPAGPTLLSFDNLNNGGVGYPNEICNPNISHSRGSGAKVAEWFNTNCFVTPPQYTFGNANRSSVIAPGSQLWDIALQKNTRISDRFSTEFRGEFFNAFNHENLGLPNLSYGTPEFGVIESSAAPPRQIQFGLKILF